MANNIYNCKRDRKPDVVVVAPNTETVTIMLDRKNIEIDEIVFVCKERTGLTPCIIDY